MKQWINFYKKKILGSIGEEAIFRKYLNREPTVGIKVTNPLRRDEHPGCTFTRSGRTGRLYFNDYAIGKSYDCFAIVMEKYGVDFWTAMRMIEKDFKLDFLNAPVIKSEKIETPTRVRNRVITFVKNDKFSAEELEYWKQFGIEESHLKQYSVISVKELYVNDKLRWSNEEYPIFAIEHQGGRAKFYRPHATKEEGRWLATSTKDDIAFASSIPFLGDLCIITKSFKDALLLNVLGWPAVAPNSEAISLKNSVSIRGIQMTYDNIVVFYDNDKAGLQGGKDRSQELGCSYIYLPKDCGAKDISDYYLKYGKDQTIDMMNKLLQDVRK